MWDVFDRRVRRARGDSDRKPEVRGARSPSSCGLDLGFDQCSGTRYVRSEMVLAVVLFNLGAPSWSPGRWTRVDGSPIAVEKGGAVLISACGNNVRV